MNNIKSLTIEIKSKDAIKPDIVELQKSEKCPQEKVLPESKLYRHLY